MGRPFRARQTLPLARLLRAAAGPDAAARAGKVRAALNAIVFAHTPPFEIAVNPLAAGLIVVVLGARTGEAAGIAFFVASCLVLLVNSAIWFAFRRDAERDRRPAWWHGWLVFGAAFNGLVWGIGSAFVFPHGDLTFVAAVLPIVLAGFAGGYVASQSASPTSVMAFIWLAFTPLALRLALDGTAADLLVAGAMLLYAGVLSFFCLTSFRSVHEMVLLRIANESLVEELRKTAENIEKIADNLPGTIVEGVIGTDGSSRLLYASGGFEAVFGVDPAATDGDLKPLLKRILPADRPRHGASARGEGSDAATWPIQQAYRYDNPVRGLAWIEVRGTGERMPGGDIRWYAFARDATGDRERERLDSLLATVFRTTNDAAFLADTTLRIVTANAAFLAMFGLERADGLPLRRLLRGPDSPKRLRAIRAALDADGSWRGEVPITPPSGNPITTIASLNIARDGEGRFASLVGVLFDISRLKEQERRLADLANRDALTGLPNRRALVPRIEAAIAGGGADRLVAIHFIDLDDFKQVNDLHGHIAGDRVLAAVAGRLGGLVRGDDVVFRIGGDEFVILQCGATGIADIEALDRRVVAAVAAPIAVDGSVFSIGVSIGVAIHPRDGATAAALLGAADAAVYRVKDGGKGSYRLHQSPDATSSGARP